MLESYEMDFRAPYYVVSLLYVDAAGSGETAGQNQQLLKYFPEGYVQGLSE